MLPALNNMKSYLLRLFSDVVKFLDNRYIILGFFFIILLVLILPSSPTNIKNMEIGDVAPKTIRSNVSMLVEDKEATKVKVLEATKNVLPVFEYHESYFSNEVNMLKSAFLLLKSNHTTKNLNVFFKQLNLPSNKQLFLRIIQNKPRNVERYAIATLESLNDYFIVKSSNQLYKFPKQLIKVIYNGNNKAVLLNRSDVVSLERAKIISYNFLRSQVPYNNILRATVWDLVDKLIRPNLVYSLTKTDQARKGVIKQISPVFFKISKGEVIVREGDIVTPSEYVKLKALNSLAQKQSMVTDVASKFLMLFIFFIGLAYVYKELKSENRIKSNIHILILGSSIIIQLFIFKIFVYFANAAAFSNSDFSKFTIIFSMPFTFAALMSILLTDFKSSFLVSIFVSISIWFLGTSSIKDFLAVYAFLGSLVGIFSILKEKTRFGIIKSGFYISAINVVMVLIYYMHSGNVISVNTMYDSLFAIVGGFLSVIMVSGFLPIYEFIFNITTDIKLLEMGNLNNRLLKDLAIRAPGTYHHSIIVSSLSEAAALAIGANSLIVKVGSYYHDIGKIRRPEYFIENQIDGINYHDKLKPSISALVIINHVKYGIEIAKKRRLGSYIMNIIQQHHGTSLIKYFYNKAKEKGNEPNENDFRYKGPKPQTKETGIVMLADVVEAASKTLSSPTSSHLSEFVRKITESVFLDGQLDECELTLRDLNLIVDSFVNVLVGIYHHRIEYPEKRYGNNDNR